MANFHYIIKIIDYYARNRTVTFSNWNDGRYYSSSTGGGGPGGAQFECIIPNNIIIIDATFYHSGSNTSNHSRVSVSQNAITLSKAGTNIISCSTGNHNHSLIGDNNQLLIKAGDTLTCTISQSFNANTSTPMAGGGPGSVMYTATAIQQNVYLDLICEVPTIHEVLTASDIIQLSSIFNTTPVSQNDIIALSPVQEIGTQVGTMFYASSGTTNVFNETTINNTVGPVTFSTTKPQYADIIAVTDKMTDNYYAVQATRL